MHAECWCNLLYLQSFPGGSVVKNPPTNVGDMGLIPRLGRSPEEGNGNLLQYSCLENLTERGAWRATVHRLAESWAQLKQLSTHTIDAKSKQLVARGWGRIKIGEGN